MSNKILPAGTRYSSWSLPSLIPPAVVEDAPGMLPFPEELLPPEPAPLIEPAAEELELADEAAPSATPWPSAEELEALHNQAWQEGYQAGLAAGHAKGQSEVEHIGRIAANMAQAFESLQQDLAPEVLALACEIAAQVIRAELVLSPEKLLPLLRHTTASLPLPERPCAVELHPEDLELVARLAPLDPEHWQTQANTRLERGGFVIRTPHGQVDARLETRWQLLMRVLGQDLAWSQQGQDADG